MRNQELLTILIVSGGGFQGQALIEGLRQNDSVRILLADSASLSGSQYLVDAAYQVPSVRHPQDFIDSLLTLCTAEDISIMIPATEIELPLLAEHRSRFEREGISVMVSERALLRKMQDKRALPELAADAGVSSLPNLVSVHPHLPFPLLAKPVHGWGGRRQAHLSDQDSCNRFFERFSHEEFVLQECWSDFVEYSVDFAIRNSLERTACVVRVRRCTTGGFANITEASDEPAVLKLAERFASYLAKLGGRGIFNLQFLKSGEDLVLSDINPRIGTSGLYSLGQGINLPLFLCDREISHPSEVIPDATRMVRHLSQHWMGSSPNSSVKAIVFDLDDTLLDHKSWIVSKLLHVVDLHANLVPERNVFLRTALRILEEGTRSHLFDEIAKELQLSDGTRRALIAAYRSFVPRGACLFPDVRGTLAQLRRQGLRLGLLTDNPPMSQREKLQVAGIESCFDALVFSREEGSEKPSNAGFDAIAKRLQVETKCIAMVGDSVHRDVIGALNAGFGYAALLCRQGVFHNPNLLLLDVLLAPEERGRVRVIRGLRELHWHFTESET